MEHALQSSALGATLDTVVVSAATLRLVQGYVECQELGVHTLKGVTPPVAVYRILRSNVAQGRLDAVSVGVLTPFVGRRSEMALLLERWVQVKEGTGHVVLLSGEAGIDKSRLAQMLKDHAVGEAHIGRQSCIGSRESCCWHYRQTMKLM